MAMGSRTFRVFVSSTFSDLKAERNALHEYVWPALSALCRQYGARFQAIDLRWGVSEEASLDQQTIPICLREITRCREVSPKPNFIAILGDRYGWRPLPSTIPAHEMPILLKNLSQQERDRLIWSEEQPADRRGWYRRDDNAVPPQYVLLPRQPDSRFADFHAWAEEEHILLTILERASHDLPAGNRLRYGASATEQEIDAGALSIQDTREHIHFFFRSIEGLPETVAALPANDIARNFCDYTAEGTRQQSAQNRLAALKSTLKEIFKSNVHEIAGVRWGPLGQQEPLSDGTDSPITLDHLDQFCLDVFEALARTILSELRDQQALNPQLVEEMAHDNFRKKRSRVFVGRQDVLDRIATSLASNDRFPLLIHGVSGSGKSALIARAVAKAWETHGRLLDHTKESSFGIASSGARILVRFIGATPESSNCRTLLHGMCRELARNYHSEILVPDDFADLMRDFQERLTKASSEQPLIIFIDALDQLDEADNARALFWLPTELPEHVHIVISATSESGNRDSDCYLAIQQRLPRNHQIALEPLRPDEASELLEVWLAEVGRTLDGGRSFYEIPTGQRAEVLKDRESAGLPIYLQFAFETARQWHSFTPTSDTLLAQDTKGIIRNFFRQLARDGNHGPLLVQQSLALLAAAKHGLTEGELLDLLSPINEPAIEIQSLSDADWRARMAVRKDWSVLADYHRRSPHSPRVERLPVVLWSRLALDLGSYLVERNTDDVTLFDFYHRLVREVVEEDYLQNQNRRACHSQLAEYFDQQPLETMIASLRSEMEFHLTADLGRVFERLRSESGIKESATIRAHSNLRKLSELPYAQLYAERYSDLLATLTSPEFGEMKVRGMGVWNLIADYELVLSLETRNSDIRKHAPGLRQIRDALKLSADALSRDGAHYRSQIVGRLLECDLPEVQSLLQAIFHGGGDPWIRPLKRCLVAPGGALLRTLPAPGVTTIAVRLDGRLTASGFIDGKITLWDGDQSSIVHTLHGHNGAIDALAISRDGRWMVSGSADQTVRVWDVETGQHLRMLDGHQSSVTCVGITPDCTRIISGSSDKTVKVWELATGRLLRTLEGSWSGITSLAIAADSRRILFGCIQAFMGWDIQNGNQLGLWPGFGTCTSVALSEDGRWALSAFQDVLSLWDLQRNRKIGDLSGHITGYRIHTICIGADALTAISAGGDGTLRLWDLSQGRLLATLAGHNAAVTNIGLFSDGSRVVSCSQDGTIKLWNLENARKSEMPDKPINHVQAVSVAADDTSAISGNHDGSIALWDPTTGDQVDKIRASPGPICDLFMLPDSMSAVSVSLDMPLREDLDLEWVPGPVIVTPTGSTKCTIRVWDLKSHVCIRSWQNQSGFVKSIAVLPDGWRAVTGSADKRLRIWDLRSGECIRVMDGHEDVIWAVSVSANGDRLVSASWDKTLKIWDARSGICLRTLKSPQDRMKTALFTPDGQQIISGSNDGSIIIWNSSSGEIKNIIRADFGAVRSLAVCPDGHQIIATFANRLLQLISLATGSTIAEFQFDRPIGPVATTSDGLSMLVGDATGNICFFRLPSTGHRSSTVAARR